MFDAFYIGATGMQAQQLNLDTIANNVANVNTPGFKKARVSFSDLMAIETARLGAAGAGAMDGVSEAGSLGSLPRMGSGVGVASLTKLFDLGSINQTASAWDLAIEGDGFLQVALQDGSTAFTRGGTLKVNNDGVLATRSGQPLKPGITVPANATAIAVAADGTVTATVPNQSRPVQLGQLQLVRFASPTGLVSQGDNLYRATEASGEPIAGNTGQEGIGNLRQGYLEGSNVKMVDEMVSLMMAQRAYEASMKVVQASDDLMGMVNNLRK